MNVVLEGGSGRATVDSPAALTVADGKMTASIVWSSPNYDYMIVDGEKYLPTNTEGNSTFVIPVAALGTPLSVTADTVAMSTPARDRIHPDVHAGVTAPPFVGQLPPACLRRCKLIP